MSEPIRLHLHIGLGESSRWLETMVAEEVIQDEAALRLVVQSAVWEQAKLVRERFLKGERFLPGEP